MVPGFETEYTPDDGEPASHAVLRAVAAVEGIPPADLRPPLGDLLDTDALDDLFERGGADVAVTFRYRGYRVSVSGDGRVAVEDDPA